MAARPRGTRPRYCAGRGSPARRDHTRWPVRTGPPAIDCSPPRPPRELKMTTPFDIVRPSGEIPVRPSAPITLDVPALRDDSPFGPYVLSPELATTVNVALALGQPLLVTGEPGCGKTALAWAVAKQLGCDVLEFHTKSTSTARDVLYQVDSLRRFYDANRHNSTDEDATQYIDYGALGKAIKEKRTRVVLIDEIDKAPRDFPNDLLNE